MKEWKNKDISAVGSALTLMIENLIITMMQPMKDMISELKSDVESIKEWCAEELASMVGNICVMRDDIADQINEGINSLGMPTLPQLDIMFSDIEGAVRDLQVRTDEIDETIEENEDNIEKIVSKLGLIGEVLND